MRRAIDKYAWSLATILSIERSGRMVAIAMSKSVVNAEISVELSCFEEVYKSSEAKVSGSILTLHSVCKKVTALEDYARAMYRCEKSQTLQFEACTGYETSCSQRKIGKLRCSTC